MLDFLYVNAAAFKVVVLGFGLLIDKDIFAIDLFDNSCYKHLFYYLQLGKDIN